MTRKICVVVTARPSYARIRSAMRSIAAHPQLRLQTVVTASALSPRYGDAAAVMEREGFAIDAKLPSLVEEDSLAASVKTTANGMIALSDALIRLKPDAVVTVADRYETMATAIAASYMNVPLAHVQGGEITGSIDEKVRHAITKLADLHFVASEKARERVLRMGEQADAVHVTGCPSIDVAREALGGTLPANLVARHGAGGGAVDLAKPFIVVLQHPVTTEHGQARAHVLETLEAVKALDMQALWFWPNVDAGGDETSAAIREFRDRQGLPKVHFFRNLPPEDFIRLLRASRGIVGNSSVAIRECAWLGVPAVNIGSRQQGRDRGGNVIDVANDRAAILAALKRQTSIGRLPADTIYGDGHAGERIADLLAEVALTFEKKLAY